MSIRKSVLISLEKYNRLLDKSKDESVEKTPQILHQVEEEEQTGRGSDNDTGNSKWLFGIPTTYKRNVTAILDHLRDHKDVLSWNDRGEIVYKGRVIPGSNLSDLLKDSQRQYKTLDPYGDREFYRGWAELNIPEGLLGNDERKKEVRYYKNHPGDRYIPPPPGVHRKASAIKKARYIRTLPRKVVKKRNEPVRKWLRL